MIVILNSFAFINYLHVCFTMPFLMCANRLLINLAEEQTFLSVKAHNFNVMQ